MVVCTTRRNELISRAAEAGVGFRVLGTAGGDRLVVEGLVDVGVDELTAAWRGRLCLDLLDELAPAYRPTDRRRGARDRAGQAAGPPAASQLVEHPVGHLEVALAGARPRRSGLIDP